MVIKRLQFDLNKGLRELVKTRKGKNKLTKNFKTETSKILSDNPRDIIDLLFGKEFSIKDVNSWENAINSMESKDFINSGKIREILQVLVKGIKNKIRARFKDLDDEQKTKLIDDLGNSFKKYKSLWDNEVAK